MARATDIINKLLGAGLMTASTGFFIAAFSGPFAHVGSVIPGLLFGAGGFWLVARREGPAALEPEVKQRMERLADAVTTVQNELTAMQDTLQRLGEEHDFMRQLATPSGRAPGLPAGTPPRTAESGTASSQ